MTNTLPRATPPARQAVSIFAGNTIQISGVVIGSTLLWIAVQPLNTAIRVLAMLAGYVLIYLTSHSLMHYMVGRLVGIQFKRYSIGGSFHASAYPAPLRIIFERLPFMAAHTKPESMRSASPLARALMFAAGITSTILFSTAATLFVYWANAPGALALLVFHIIWQVSSLISEMRPTGDLGKALSAIKTT